MNQYIDFKKYLQTEIGDDYYVSNERNLDSTDDKINIIVKALAGNVYNDSATIPYQIEIFTSDPEKVLKDFNLFASSHNNKSFISIMEGKLYNIIGVYTTPTIMDSDIDFIDNHFTRIVVFANMFIMFDLVNVGKLTIDGEEIEILNGSISYNTELHSQRISGNEHNINYKQASNISLSFTMINKDGIFSRKLSALRKGLIKGNTIFEVQLFLTNSTQETYQMIVNSSVLTWQRSALPSVNVSMMEGDFNATS